MAIKDLQERLKKSEGASGDLLYNELLAALDKVWADGYGGEKTPLLDSYWNEAYEEFKKEGKKAVGKGKSKDTKEVLGDLKDLQKSIAVTEEISGSGIAAGTLKMIDAIEPHIQKRIKTLGKNEGIFKSMKKKAIGSAVGAVESFASGLLAPLPFGAGEAIIGKAKEFLGGDRGERREEQAVTFAGKVGRGAEEKENGGETSPIEKITEEIMGGDATGGGGGGLEKTNEILTEIEEHLQFMTDNMEDAESRRERLRDKGLKKAGGSLVGPSMEEGEDDGGPGFWSGLIGGAGGLGGLIGLKTLIGKGIFAGKGGLFRNLKAALLRAARTAFGKGGGQMLSKIFTGLGVLGKLAGIAGVVIAPIIDGILGYFNAEKWGVSKMSGIIGGVFGGGEGGIFNMFMNAGKWAIIGATAGSVFPVVGTLIGGIAGAILGAILGFFGGDKIAKLMDSIGEWFAGKWRSLKVALGLEEATKEEMATDISEERENLLKQQAYAEKQTQFGGKRFFKTEEGKKKRLADITAQLSALDAESENVEGGGTRGQSAEDIETIRLNEIAELENRIKADPSNAGVSYMQARLTELKSKKPQGQASGGYIINRPTYLPSSGVVVGEHPTYSGGGGAYRGRLTIGDGNPEAIIPLHEGSEFIEPMARSVAGAVMNTLAMERIGHERGRGSMYDQPPAIIDNSTVQNISNNTLIRPPSPSGPNLHFEGRDFVHKIA